MAVSGGKYRLSEGAQAASGLALTTLIIYQWLLLTGRMSLQKLQVVRTRYQAHRWVGVAAMVLFGIHAVRMGYGWTNALSLTFISLSVTGLMNREIIRYRSPWLFNVWLWTHIALASALMPLLLIHIWVALAYE